MPWKTLIKPLQGDPPLTRRIGIIERASNSKGHIVQALYEQLLVHSVAAD